MPTQGLRPSTVEIMLHWSAVRWLISELTTADRAVHLFVSHSMRSVPIGDMFYLNSLQDNT